MRKKRGVAGDISFGEVNKSLIYLPNHCRIGGWLTMAEIGLRTRMVVKDVMSSPVITVDEDATVDKAAQLMA
ncbi:MAG: CBS domain-containing protein, partial [Candidatus Bathyarchaeota archaeon]|nr:CBS domain-containing protein [Candidatus Bathyarchaeota archaeon]